MWCVCGPLAVHEPVRVVAVVDTPDTRGFAYGTLRGHPVSGEEAFIVRKAPDGRVTLTLRSLTAPPPRGCGGSCSRCSSSRNASTVAATSACSRQLT